MNILKVGAGGMRCGICLVALGFAVSSVVMAGPEEQRRPMPLRPARGPDRQAQERPQAYSLEQAISDRAQLHTIAFDGLAFLSGSLGADTFLPPGKVSDFFGFQYMRDIDAARLGHNTSFLTRIANQVLSILTEEQLQQLMVLGEAQAPKLRELALRRFPLMHAFRRNLEGVIPSGSSGLDRAAVMRYSGELFAFAGELAYQRAETLGGIARSLSDQQRARLAQLKFGDSRTWPETAEAFDRRRVSHAVHVAIMTYASEFFSWYAGSVEADTYFCPEGHGTYFGAFYLKDAPAMHQRNYSISTSLTGDKGAAFLALLEPSQRSLIEGIVELQRADLGAIVETRRAISSALRRFLKEDSVSKEKVITLCRHYGECDGALSYYYATRFAQVNALLTKEQHTALAGLRDLEAYPSANAYLYSEPIDAPEFRNTDFLFTGSKR